MSITNQIARTILNGFNAMHADFQNITLGAKARFERNDWHSVDKAQRDRLDVYEDKVSHIPTLLGDLAGKRIFKSELWCDVKAEYNRLIENNVNAEIAESFYNSVFRKFYQLTQLNDRNAYVFDTATINYQSMPDLYQFQINLDNLHANTISVETLLNFYQFNAKFAKIKEDSLKIAQQLEYILKPLGNTAIFDITIIDTVFYRNKGAYLLGLVTYTNLDNNLCELPLLIALTKGKHDGETNDELVSGQAISVDAVISDVDEISIIFSFSRTYFMVDSEMPRKIVNFLKRIMPHKKTYELYTAIGYRRHGKSLFYRAFLEHLQHSDDNFISAPGVKGMVMLVFTLPSYDVVFKIIKDRFTPPKEVTHEIVREKYNLVMTHDRAGRMADTQEFFQYRLPLKHFSDELLNELEQMAPSAYSTEGDDIVIHHLYTERRMVPLNIYLRDATEHQTRLVMDDYGKAIKDLVAANIFPGDMLLKNFGVTRHGRVIFYDYDEICHITECNFRTIPEPQTEEQAMASKPWYQVAENDVFPEEFRMFFSGNPKAREAFEFKHRDLYDANWWLDIQQKIKDDTIIDVFPYRSHWRIN